MIGNYSLTQLSQAEEMFDYLAVRSPMLDKADVIMGFGHFDLKIPRQCGALYQEGYASRLIFSGGIGSGTADLGQPEARAFFKELKRRYPSFPQHAVMIKDQSTNTSENIRFTMQKLTRFSLDFTSDHHIRSAILVANAYRQRRVYLTCRTYMPRLTLYNAPPVTTFENEFDMFAEKGQDFIELLLGEIDRLIRYGEAGDLVRETIPENIMNLYMSLQCE